MSKRTFDDEIRLTRMIYAGPAMRPGPIEIRLTWPQTELLRDLLDFAEAEYLDGRDRAKARRIRSSLHRAELATLPFEAIQDLQDLVPVERRLTVRAAAR